MFARRSLMLCAASAAVLVLAGCSSNSPYFENDGPPTFFKGSEAESATPRVEPFKKASLRPYKVLGKWYTPVTSDTAMRQTGTASWYGKQFHGKKTSTGETYDMYEPTAAHPTMPLPSYARVTNLENGRSIIVRVNDRGPFLHSRVIDLSYAAAKALGYSSKGTAKVEVRRLTWSEIRSGTWKSGGSAPAAVAAAPVTKPVTTPAPAPLQTAQPASAQDPVYEAEDDPVAAIVASAPPMRGWGVQVGSFSQLGNAQAFAAHAEAVLAADEGGARSVRIVEDGTLWRVIVGGGMTHEAAANDAKSVGSRLGVNAFSIER